MLILQIISVPIYRTLYNVLLTRICIVALWLPLCLCLGALTRGRADAQLAAVYALQLHAHALRYPRGLLLRWFMYLYNLEVCEEDAFLRWREDVTDEYPGKGEALFQVQPLPPTPQTQHTCTTLLP